jgi:hypothetical protein
LAVLKKGVFTGVQVGTIAYFSKKVMQQISLSYLVKFIQKETQSFLPVDLTLPLNAGAADIANAIREFMTSKFGVGFHIQEVYLVKSVIL